MSKKNSYSWDTYSPPALLLTFLMVLDIWSSYLYLQNAANASLLCFRSVNLVVLSINKMKYLALERDDTENGPHKFVWTSWSGNFVTVLLLENGWWDIFLNKQLSHIQIDFQSLFLVILSFFLVVEQLKCWRMHVTKMTMP